MNDSTRREVIAALLKLGRRDLARHFAGAAMKQVDMLRFEEALTRAVYDTAKKQKMKVTPKAKQQLSYIVKKWVDTVDKMLAA